MIMPAMHFSPLLPIVPIVCEANQTQSAIERKRGFKLHQITWVNSGSLTVKIEGETKTLHAGEGFFFKKNVPHHYSPNDAKPIPAGWFCFLGGDDLFNYYNIKNHFFFKAPFDISASMEKLENDLKASDSPIMQSAIAYKWIAELFDKIFYIPQNEAQRIEAYLEQNLALPLTLEAIAEEFGFDKFALCKKYKSLTGKTIMETLKNVRIKKAEQLLWLTHRTVEDIGAACGFTDTSYFIKNFKDVTGTTPKQYRKLKNESLDAHEYQTY